MKIWVVVGIIAIFAIAVAYPVITRLLTMQHNENMDNSLMSKDTDNDGLPDYRENQLGTNPLSPDTDKDGIWDGYEVENMAQYGANPLRRDIFVEIDKMDEPPEEAEWRQVTRWLTENEKLDLVAVFKNAPILNPDGTRGVDLHLFENDIVPYVDVWENGGVNNNKSFAAFLNYHENYRSYVGEGFYYCALVSGGSFSYDYGFSVNAITGDSMSGIFLHELGHSLGLAGIFDGIDSNKYTFAEYPSVMNTMSEVGYLGYSGSGNVFDDWGYLQEHGFKLHEYYH